MPFLCPLLLSRPDIPVIMGNVAEKAPSVTKEESQSVLQHDCSVGAIAEYIRSGRAKQIVVMVGAGVSVSAGIPDFRTPGTGLYDNLQKYDLPSPQAIFEIDYFQQHPEAFYKLAQVLVLVKDGPRPEPLPVVGWSQGAP